ncbi:hypothetical protein HpMS120_08750 [Helicobacter pylori]|uniref:hypothetical protein n=1 Tax=Helicobacter pylori TaxID=210 RepID=UPI001E5452C7|nr:hypothetical protein [Helicobacter pylori]
MMVLENACEFKDYLASVFDEMGFYGSFEVVEQVSNAKNELMLKTMYKARGNYKDSLIYKKTLAKSQNSN